MIEKLYTVEEVAQLASVTGRTIRNYLKSGRLVGRKIGGQWRFPESEVQRLLSGGEVPAEDFAEDNGYSSAPEPEPYMESYTPEPPSYNAAPVNNGVPLQASSSMAQPVLQPAPAPTFSAPGAQGPGAAPSAATPSPLQNNTNMHRAQEHSAPAYGESPYHSSPVPAQTLPPTMPTGVGPGAAAAPGAPATGSSLSQNLPGGPSSKYAPPSAPAPSGSQGMYNAPAPLPTPSDVGVPPAPGQPGGAGYPEYETNGGYAPEPYTETYEYEQPPAVPTAAPAAAAPSAPAEPEPAMPEPAPENGVPALSDTGFKVLQFVAEVHDCTAGAQTCTVIEVIHSLNTAQHTITQLAHLAGQESQSGIPCECYVEFDERYSVARYTLFGSAPYLARALQLIG